jgi:PAS domain S-box-containing protein
VSPKESPGIFKKFIESASEAFILLDENLNCLSINKVGAKLLGMSKKELIGKNVTEVVPDIKESGRYDIYMNVIRTGKPFYSGELIPNPTFGDKRLIVRAFKTGKGMGMVVSDATNLRKAEERLRKSEQDYRVLFNSSIDGMFVVDAETMKIVLVNEAGKKMGLRYGIKDVSEIDLMSYIPPDDRNRILKIIVEDMFEKDLRRVNEFRVVPANGQEVWLSAVGTKIEYQGKPAGLVSVRDITQRKQAEDALRRSEDFFRSVIENALDGIVVLNMNGKIIYGSPSIERLLGYRQEELIGTDCFGFTHPDEIPNDVKLFNDISLNPETSVLTESVVRHKDGSWHIVEAVASTVSANKGLEGIVVNWRDITERKRLEELLRESEDRYRDIVENSLEGIYQVDISGKFIFINESFARTFGYEREELIGKHFSSMLDAETASKVAKMVEDVFSGNNVRSEVPVRHKDGRGIPVSFSATQLRREGKIIGLSGILNDVSERRRIEDDLRNLSSYLQHAREAERALIARQIHDELGQTLTALKMDLSWINNRLNAEQEPLLKKTRAMLELTDKTIRTVRTLSSELSPRVIDDLGLEAALDWLTGEFQNRTGIECKLTLKSKDIALERERATAAFRIFQEALTNIARHANATKVKVSLQKTKGRLVLKIVDNGKGITEEQVSNPRSFGLMGMRERARFCGGEVEIIGSQNKGTAVIVRIPINKEGPR